MAMSECRVAFVGAGGMAREHVRAFRDISGVTLAGIHSRTRARAEALAGEFAIPVVADSVGELYARTKADLVVVSVPELSANAVAKACFEHPWTAVLEKPAGVNIQDAEDIAAAADRASRRAYVALNRRQYSATRLACEKLATDTGARFIRVQDQQDQSAALASGQPARVVENWMYANSIHLIDYFQILGRGEVVAVDPVIPWETGRPGVVVASLRFSSGDLGLYEGVWNGPGPWAITVSTPQQRFEMRPLEQLGVQVRGERRVVSQEIDPRDAAFKAGFRLQAEKAVANALGGQTDLPTLREGIGSMHLVRRIFAPGRS